VLCCAVLYESDSTQTEGCAISVPIDYSFRSKSEFIRGAETLLQPRPAPRDNSALAIREAPGRGPGSTGPFSQRTRKRFDCMRNKTAGMQQRPRHDHADWHMGRDRTQTHCLTQNRAHAQFSV